MAEKNNSEGAGELIFRGAMSLPLIKVDREKFLSKIIPPGKEVDWSDHVPADFYSRSELEKFAKGSISKHKWASTAVSASLGLIPPGPWTVAGISGDVIQYTGHVLILAQKLAYLYGFPPLTDGTGKWTDAAENSLILFLGVALGCEGANQAIKKFVPVVAAAVAKRLPKHIAANAAWFAALKKVLPVLGIHMGGKAGFAKAVAKGIPILGAGLSGGITFFSFGPMAKRLLKNFQDDADSFSKWDESVRIE